MVYTVGEEPEPAARIRKRQGELIRQYRGLRGLKQAEFAAKFNPPVTEAAVSQWENGRYTPRQHLQLEIARILDCPWSAIFGLDRVA